MSKFINIDERYGDAVEVTIDDYRELNPNGTFEQETDRILEVWENEEPEYLNNYVRDPLYGWYRIVARVFEDFKEVAEDKEIE